MKKIQVLLILLSAILFIPTIAGAQEKLILRKGLKRAKLKSGMQVLPITTNDTCDYHSWKDRKINDYNFPKDSIWTFDSIASDRVYLSRITSYEEAFFTKEKYNSLPKKDKKRFRDDWDKHPNPFVKGKRMKAFRKPIKEQKEFALSTLKSIHFAKAKNHSKIKNTLLYTGFVSGSLIAIPNFYYSRFMGLIVYLNPSHLIGGLALASSSYYFIDRMKVKEYELRQWELEAK